MKKQNSSYKLFLTALVIFFFIFQGNAQTSTNAAGGDAAGAGGSVAYSVGQPSFSSIFNTALHLANLQPIS